MESLTAVGLSRILSDIDTKTLSNPVKNGAHSEHRIHRIGPLRLFIELRQRQQSASRSHIGPGFVEAESFENLPSFIKTCHAHTAS